MPTCASRSSTVARVSGGHWRQAYPFVRLHQSSVFYGVASTVLGGGRIQEHGPEAGLHERADQPTICAYYDDVLADRMSGPAGSSSSRAATTWAIAPSLELDSGRAVRGAGALPDRRRALPRPRDPGGDAAEVRVAEGARVIPVNDLVRWEEAPSQYVVVGSGKTATDACIWLLARGVDPDAICWVRPREPWMLSRR